MRVNQSYASLEEIIEAIGANPNGGGVWVGKNYSIKDLTEDLNHILCEYQNTEEITDESNA